MKLNKKLSPYPILSTMDKDYVEGLFKADIKVEHEMHSLSFYVTYELDEPKLMALIDNGKAVFVTHIECALVGFRKAIISQNKKVEESIEYDNFVDEVEISTFVVAKKDIKAYTNSNFGKNFEKNASFDIWTGGVLAIGDTVPNTVKDIVNAYEAHLSSPTALPYDDTSGIGAAPFKDNQGFMKKINNGAFGNDDGETTPTSTTITPALLNRYVAIADQGHDKYFSMFLQLGEKSLSDYKKKAKAAYDKGSDKYNKETTDTGKEKESGLNRMKHAYQRICNVIKMGSSVYSRRIQIDYNDAIRVCRAAVRYQAGDTTAGTSNESFTDFNSMLAEIL